MSKKKMTAPKGIYFPNLNGLRFLAAFLVVVHHMELMRPEAAGIFSSPISPFIHLIGRLGVILFFVLSGFLITYLLMSEEKKNGVISVKKFYIRRVLRIWPLYFLIFSLCLYLLPHFSFFIIQYAPPNVILAHMGAKTLMYLLFVPILTIAFYGGIPLAMHLWSVGTEELFYLIWPVILNMINKKRLILMGSIIAIYLLVRTFVEIRFQFSNPFSSFWSTFNIDCMAIGAIYAYLLFRGSNSLNFFMNKYLFYGSILLVLYLIWNAVTFSIVTYEVYSIFFGIIILNFAANKKIKISLENPVFNYLGKISYGLYMFHPVIVYSCLKLCFMMHYTSVYVIYPVSIAVTIAVSALSYKYFESPFLRIKDRFT